MGTVSCSCQETGQLGLRNSHELRCGRGFGCSPCAVWGSPFSHWKERRNSSTGGRLVRLTSPPDDVHATANVYQTPSYNHNSNELRGVQLSILRYVRKGCDPYVPPSFGRQGGISPKNCLLLLGAPQISHDCFFFATCIPGTYFRAVEQAFPCCTAAAVCTQT